MGIAAGYDADGPIWESMHCLCCNSCGIEGCCYHFCKCCDFNWTGSQLGWYDKDTGEQVDGPTYSDRVYQIWKKCHKENSPELVARWIEWMNGENK